jgi:hypothetical protein
MMNAHCPVRILLLNAPEKEKQIAHEKSKNYDPEQRLLMKMNRIQECCMSTSRDLISRNHREIQIELLYRGRNL